MRTNLPPSERRRRADLNERLRTATACAVKFHRGIGQADDLVRRKVTAAVIEAFKCSPGNFIGVWASGEPKPVDYLVSTPGIFPIVLLGEFHLDRRDQRVQESVYATVVRALDDELSRPRSD
jgi:hypothetical protein